MIVSVEISYYPLTSEYNQPVEDFLNIISNQSGVSVEPGNMSTLISGEYSKVMEILNHAMGDLMEHHASVFNLKISNSCPI